jgi:hypothetical protein
VSVAANPFIDPNDGHVLADDMEAQRELNSWLHPAQIKAPKRKKAVKDGSSAKPVS